ncbi:bestrophin family protein [Dyadobacter arcticus]|uniref:Membrane protein n=1 Tax=Dyadobacter arcticus TaxID=1078754 RepID=A0ABX0ULP3_9BACT|nr:bestrophin family ion channel [Dyadobacter arcticus]NIJ53928.1 putative membrane protein [Dyadobacter arcticus]
MYTAREIKLSIVWSFAWKIILFFFIYSLFLCCISFFSGITLGISFVPIGLIGTAVAFYVGFKNNSSYERLWEARRIWGSIVNASRTWGTFACSYVHSEDHHALKTQLIHRHIAYVNAVRLQLRAKSVWNDANSTAHAVVKEHLVETEEGLKEMLNRLLPADEAAYVLSKKNPATHVMKMQGKQLDDIFMRGEIRERFYFQMMNVVQEFYSQQGAAERIKNFPFPRQYAYFSKVFVWLFVLILPFGLINEFAKLGPGYLWFAIPSYIVIAWVFYTMEVVGDTSENPFENAINDIPMTAICRTIEIDLREMLDEGSIPAPVAAVNNILM